MRGAIEYGRPLPVGLAVLDLPPILQILQKEIKRLRAFRKGSTRAAPGQTLNFDDSSAKMANEDQSEESVAGVRVQCVSSVCGRCV